MFHRFYGGIRPADHKNTTRLLPIAAMKNPPAHVVLSLEGYGGALCAPIVAVGDRVARGQAVAQPENRGCPVYSSISGSVVAIEPRPNALGGKSLSVVVENDGGLRVAPPLEMGDPEGQSPSQIVERLRLAAVAGLGGGGYPTWKKLEDAMGKVDTLLINGAECEPYVTADCRVMLESPQAVVDGSRILMKALGLSHLTIAVEGDKTDGVSALRRNLPLRGGDVSVKTLRVRYPQGSETQLVQRLTGRQVPPGERPTAVGCVVFNVATAAAVSRAVREGQPLLSRVVTVTGSAIEHPGNVEVPLGTPMELLAEEAGELHGGPSRLLAGGPMMGKAQFDLAAPVTAGIHSLVFLRHRDYVAPPRREPVCIRCGKCVSACPMHLMPLSIHGDLQSGRLQALAKLHPQDCMYCGACSYVCPAHIPLVNSIRQAQALLKGEPAEEVIAEPVAKSVEEPAAEVIAEPVEEPTAEPTAEPSSEPTAEPSTEPVAEPTAEPTAEP
ncbi:MAG: electron transport complex subunit RsxC, partial [Oscillospiraceae bacterium]